MEEPSLPTFRKKCAYCPYIFESLKIPHEKAKKLDDSSIPPTHVEIKCPECGNVYYYTQKHWDFSFSDLGWLLGKPSLEPETRKTSPGENVYVPKEEVEVE